MEVTAEENVAVRRIMRSKTKYFLMKEYFLSPHDHKDKQVQHDPPSKYARATLQ